MELFVDEHRWKSLDKSTQISLNQLIISLEDQIVPSLKAWNNSRAKILLGDTVHNESIFKVKLPIPEKKLEKRVGA